MTKYSELIAIANKLAGEDVSGQHPRTVAGAIDAITDALAGQDVDSGQTIAQAIAVLSQYAEGGGGGSVVSYVYFNPSSVRDLALTVNGQSVEMADSEMGEWLKEFTVPAGAVVEYTSTTDDSPPTLYVYENDEDITEHPYNYFGVWEFDIDATPETERWFPALAHTVAAFSSFG